MLRINLLINNEPWWTGRNTHEIRKTNNNPCWNRKLPEKTMMDCDMPNCDRVVFTKKYREFYLCKKHNHPDYREWLHDETRINYYINY